MKIINGIFTKDDDIFGSIKVYGSNPKNNRIYFNIDVLECSVCWKRIRDEKLPIYFTSLTDSTLLNYVTEVDTLYAGRIRDYYSKKIMMWLLKGNNLSRFRTDLNLFIHNSGQSISEDLLPLVFRLPEFYEQDTKFDHMVENKNKQLVNHTKKELMVKKLEYLGFTRQKRKFSDSKTYWFSDEYDNVVFRDLETNNPLLAVWEKAISLGDITIKSVFVPINKNDIQVLAIQDQFEIV